MHRKIATALLVLFGLALIPALVLAYAGAGWLDLDGLPKLSALALVAAPLAVAAGTVLSWSGTRRPQGSKVLAAMACLVIAIGLYAVASAWGGRMLI